jgi:hypothetical protein
MLRSHFSPVSCPWPFGGGGGGGGAGGCVETVHVKKIQ